MSCARSVVAIQTCIALFGWLFAADRIMAQSGTTIPSAEQQKAEHEFAVMVGRVKQGDMTMDFRAFRVAGALKSGPQASMLETGERAAFRNLMASGDRTGALDLARRALDRNYASPIAHFDAMTAYQSLDKNDEAAAHEKVLSALLHSIRQSGDGKSPDTAYFVVTVQEEYLFLNRVLHVRATSQDWVRKDGHFYDRISVPDLTTDHIQYLWFNADFDAHSDPAAIGAVKDGVLATTTVIPPSAAPQASAPGVLGGPARTRPSAPSQSGGSNGSIPRSGQFHLTNNGDSGSVTAPRVRYSLSGTYTLERDYVAIRIESSSASTSSEQPPSPVLAWLRIGVCYQTSSPTDGGRWFGPILSPEIPNVSLHYAVLKAGRTYTLPGVGLRIPIPKIQAAANWLCSLVTEENGKAAYYAHDAGRPNLFPPDLLARNYFAPAQEKPDKVGAAGKGAPGADLSSAGKAELNFGTTTPDQGRPGSAEADSLPEASAIAVDGTGNVYIATLHAVYRIDAKTERLALLAGNGSAGYSGDNGPATGAQLHFPHGVAVDATGSVYIGDNLNNVVRRVSSGTITTIAGNGHGAGRTFGGGYSGDDGPATGAELNMPAGVALDASGNLYVADWLNGRIRKVSNGVITTVAGGGTQADPVYHGPATSARLHGPSGVAVDLSGNIYVADFYNNVIRRVSNGVITTIAGNGYGAGHQGRYSGDNGPATSAELNLPDAVAVDASGNLYIADTYNNAIRKVSNGLIATIAGDGSPGYSGDNGPAANARLNMPRGVAVDASGTVYIADSGNHVVRKVSNGVITTCRWGRRAPRAF
jgi:sugar lactone lactonase YvrE